MKKYIKIWLLLFLASPIISCGQKTNDKELEKHSGDQVKTSINKGMETATFAAGCFWCVESQFKELEGVESVTSGYIGGKTKNPTYEEVSSGKTGHAEACNIVYDPNKISYAELLEAFFVAHDPTQLNRQGNDVGTQYRSAIFYHNEDQKNLAQKIINELNSEGAYPNKIVTEISPYTNFYIAEDYHQNYFENNPQNIYCQRVISPKLDKFKKVFKDKIKK